MTVIAVPSVHTPRAVVDPVPLSRITGVELRKMFNTRSGFWLIASIGITAVLATGGVILWAPDGQLPTPRSRPRSASPSSSSCPSSPSWPSPANGANAPV